MKTAAPLAVIAAAAVLVWAPTLVIAAPGDSFSYDLNWAGQFGALVRAGDPYPRWLPGSFGGLGSPTFYFYPPLSFWVAALVGVGSAGALGAAMQVKLATLALIAGSGWAMFAWLRALTTPTRALIGALAFLVAPYHLDDHYLRGAFAELAAFVAIPILALGMEQTARAVRSGPLLLAAGWAALIFAHLPIAMLTGALLVPALGLYALWRSERRLAFALAASAALAVGTALAAIYLVPALQLQDAISADYWWSARFQAADRLLTNPAAWTLPLEPFFGAISFAEAALAAWIGWLAWRARDAQLGFWAGVTILVFAAVTGLLARLLVAAAAGQGAVSLAGDDRPGLRLRHPDRACAAQRRADRARGVRRAGAGQRRRARPRPRRRPDRHAHAGRLRRHELPYRRRRAGVPAARHADDGSGRPGARRAARPAAGRTAGGRRRYGAGRAGRRGRADAAAGRAHRAASLLLSRPGRSRATAGRSRPRRSAPAGSSRSSRRRAPASAAPGWARRRPEALGAAIAGAGLAVFALYAAWLIAAGLRRRRPRLDRDRPAPI